MIFPAVRHEVSIWHGSVRSCGDLLVPATPGPHPVLVIVRAPEDIERDYSPWLDELAEAGVASFTWDRPGPASGGRPARTQVQEQAREVLRAIDRLRCMPGVNGDAVAVMGWGEGGWAAAQASTFSHHIAALILACTPFAPRADLGDHREAGAGAGAGAGAEARDGAGAGWSDGVDDPGPTLSAVTVPVLALFGEQDATVPLRRSVRAVGEALGAAGHADHEVAVVRGADHALRVPPGHGLGPMSDGLHRFGEWPAGLTSVIAGWLEHALGEPAAPTYVPPQVDRATVPAPAPSPAPPTTVSPAPPAPVGQPAHTTVPVRQVRRRIAH